MSGPAINTGSGQARLARSRGKPLAMLCLLLVAWTTGRVMVWETPWPKADSIMAPILASDTVPDRLTNSNNGAQLPTAAMVQRLQGLAPPPPIDAIQVEGLNADTLLPAGMMAGQTVFAPMDGAASPAGHQVIWMAAMSRLPVPMSVQQSFARANLPVQEPSDAVSTTDRWSADGWLY